MSSSYKNSTGNLVQVEIDSSGRIPVSVEGSVSGVGDGRKVVTTAGTRVVLASTTPCNLVIITAETDNTGVIVVGGSTVVASLSTRRGTPLNPGDSIVLNVSDLVSVYIDSTVSGDGVTFTYF